MHRAGASAGWPNGPATQRQFQLDLFNLIPVDDLIFYFKDSEFIDRFASNIIR